MSRGYPADMSRADLLALFAPRHAIEPHLSSSYLLGDHVPLSRTFSEPSWEKPSNSRPTPYYTPATPDLDQLVRERLARADEILSRDRTAMAARLYTPPEKKPPSRHFDARDRVRFAFDANKENDERNLGQPESILDPVDLTELDPYEKLKKISREFKNKAKGINLGAINGSTNTDSAILQKDGPVIITPNDGTVLANDGKIISGPTDDTILQKDGTAIITPNDGTVLAKGGKNISGPSAALSTEQMNEKNSSTGSRK